MPKYSHSTRIGAGPKAAIPPALLLSLGVTEGDYIDFDFINGTWQISGRHQVSTDYFTSLTETTLSDRLKRSIEEYVEFSNASEIGVKGAEVTVAQPKAEKTDKRPPRAKAAHE